MVVFIAYEIAHGKAVKLDGLLVDIAVAGREVVGCNRHSNVVSRPVTTRGDPRTQTGARCALTTVHRAFRALIYIILYVQ